MIRRVYLDVEGSAPENIGWIHARCVETIPAIIDGRTVTIQPTMHDPTDVPGTCMECLSK